MDINKSPEKRRQSPYYNYPSEKQISQNDAKLSYLRSQIESHKEHRKAENSATNSQATDHNQAYQYEANSDRLPEDLEGFDTKIELREPRIDGRESFDANKPNTPQPSLQTNKPEISQSFLQANKTKDIGEIVISKVTGLAGWKPPDVGKRYWIPSYHIHTEILGNEIHSLAGSRATFRSLSFKDQNGFLIETADNIMSSGDIERLRHESVKHKTFDEDDQGEPPDPVPYIGPALDPVVFVADSKRDAAKRSFDRRPLSRFGHPTPEQFPHRRRMGDLAGSDQAQTTDLDFEASIPKSKLPVDVDIKCGVVLEGGHRCERDLMCAVHSEERKNAVSGRSEPYRVLRLRAQTKWESSSLQNASEPTTRLTINEGDHLELKEEEKKDLPYVLEKILGHGGSASVEMVRDINTNSVYARKVIRNVYTRNLEAVKISFLNEVGVMRLLASHHHIIQVFATYIAHRELALILSPVADGGDLHDFLGKYQDAGIHAPGHGEKTLILYRSFGCLASGLAFMHGQRVRHKDIKPQNILVHQGSVLYTDFGISLDFSKQGQSTTIGNPQSYTKRYCAPEVADWNNRNSKSDIFSLGCVFLEIIAALQPSLIPDALLEGPYHEKLSGQELGGYFTGVPDNQFSDDFVLALTGMLSPEPNDRPKAANLKDMLCTVRSGFSMSCDLCANAKDEQKLQKDNEGADESATSTAPASVIES